MFKLNLAGLDFLNYSIVTQINSDKNDISLFNYSYFPDSKSKLANTAIMYLILVNYMVISLIGSGLNKILVAKVSRVADSQRSQLYQGHKKN